MAEQRRMRSPSVGGRVVFRQLRSQPAVVITVFLAVLIGAFLMAAAPRLLETVSRDDLRAAVTIPSADARNIAVERVGRIGVRSADEPVAKVDEIGSNFAESYFPASVNSIVSARAFVIDSPRYTIGQIPEGEPLGHNFPVTIKYRYQEGIDHRFRLVEGSMPEPQDRIPMLLGENCPTDLDERADLFERLQDPDSESLGVLGCDVREVRHVQTVVSAQTLEDMGLQLGQQVLLSPDLSDALYFGFIGDELAINFVMSVSGIVEFSDEDEEFWYDETSLHRPLIRENPDFRLIYATGLIAADDYVDVLGATLFVPWRYTWRHFVDPDLVEEVESEQLIDELRDLQLEFPSTTHRPFDFSVVTRLPDFIEDHLAQRTQTLALISSGVAALFAIVVATVLLLAVLMNARQRSSTVLTRGRGASRSQLTLTRTYEGLLLAAPAAVFGFLAAAWALPDSDPLFPYRATVALATGTVAAIVTAGLPLIRRRLGSLQREGDLTTVHAGRRLVVEILILTLAAGAVVLLRRRGQLDTPIEGFDLLLAVAPSAIALGVGVITVRVFPLVTRALAWMGARSRGVVGFVGFRRILRQDAGMRLSLIVILLCVATASFASVTRSSLVLGQERSSWQEVGAEFTVKSFISHAMLSTSVDFQEMDLVDAVALGTTFDRARVELDPGSFSAQVLAIDGADYADVTGGTEGDVALPGFLASPTPLAPNEPIPVIASTTWPPEAGLRLGDVFTLDLGRLKPTAIVAEMREVYPDTTVGRSFVILSREALQSISDLPISPTVAYLSAPASAAEALDTTLAEQAPSMRLAARADSLERIAGDPFVSWVGAGLALIAGFSVILGMVAAISSLALATAARRRDFSYLRTLGLTSKQATTMTAMEQLPQAIFAVAGGIVAGIGTAVALGPAIELDEFTGNLVPTSLEVNPLAIAAGSILLVGVLAAGVGMFAAVSRRDDLGRALRVGEE